MEVKASAQDVIDFLSNQENLMKLNDKLIKSDVIHEYKYVIRFNLPINIAQHQN